MPSKVSPTAGAPDIRIETDTMGAIEVRAGKYWGAQTERSLRNFKIGNQRFGPAVIRAFGIVKKSAALANHETGQLNKTKLDLIVKVCDEVIAGIWDDQFPLVVWQTGSGTHTNMNANEVIANRANIIAGGRLGDKFPIHPNDDVNKSQSSNDVFPTVMHIATVEAITVDLMPAVAGLRAVLAAKASEFASIVKIGRTHLMDATPLTLGQELSGYVAQLDFAMNRLSESLGGLLLLAIGGSAVGTGMNTTPDYAVIVARYIATLTGRPFRTAPNKFMMLAAHDAMIVASGATRLLATVCMKIAGDIAFLASGPRCGIGEIRIPANEPGSSIMPGKVNPTQCEALAMVAARVMGNDVTIGFAGSQGRLELNAFKPVIIHTLLESCVLLSGAVWCFTEQCAVGIEPNEAVIDSHLKNSLMLVTALNQEIGYDSAAKIANKAFDDGMTLREAAVELGVMSGVDFDRLVRPEQMTGPRESAGQSPAQLH